jgi:hypothetical protein
MEGEERLVELAVARVHHEAEIIDARDAGLVADYLRIREWNNSRAGRGESE